MSTKIYYGYKINIVNDFEELEGLRADLIRKAKYVKTQIATQLAIRASVQMLDLFQVGFDVPNMDQTVFGYGYHKVSDRFREFKKNSYRDPIYDLRFELVVFLTNPILSIFIGENKAMRGVIENHSQFEYYGYWNNTDPPEGTSDDEWEQRKKDWEFLDGPICNQGLIIALDDMLVFDVEEDHFHQNVIQDWEQRCRETARQIILHRVDQKRIEVPGLPSDVDQKNAGEFANTLYQWCEKGEGVKLIEEEMLKVETLLNKTFTYNDLFKTPFKSYIREDRTIL